MKNEERQQEQSSLDGITLSEDNLEGVTGGMMLTPEMAAAQNAELAKHGRVVGNSKDPFGQRVDIYQDGTRVYRNGLGPLVIKTPSQTHGVRNRN